MSSRSVLFRGRILATVLTLVVGFVLAIDAPASAATEVFVDDLSTLTHLDTASMTARHAGGVLTLAPSDRSRLPWLGAGTTTVDHEAARVFDVAVGDLDGDGRDDIVATGWQGPTQWYRNDGSASPFGMDPAVTVAADADYVAIGDVDGDGDADLVTTGWRTATNRVLHGDGTDQPLAGGAQSPLGTDGATAGPVVLGDLDGDGDLDAVVGTVNAAEASRIHLNDGSSEPFASPAVLFNAGFTTRGVALGDLDGDGDLDIGVANVGVNRYYLNHGDGSFDAGHDLTADDAYSRTVAFGDVDADGDLDVVVANRGGPAPQDRVILNDGTSTPFAGAAGSDLPTADSDEIALVDLDDDGDLDVTSAFSLGNEDRYLLNNGTQDPFAGVPVSKLGDATTGSSALATADLDRDGHVDVLGGSFADGLVHVHMNRGRGAPFSTSTPTDLTSIGGETGAVALDDLDRDGVLDAVVTDQSWGGSNRVHLGTGDGTFDAGADLAQSRQTSAVTLGDLDGDGNRDVVTVGWDIRTQLGQGDGTFEPPTTLVTGTQALDVELGDLNRDSHLDMVVAAFGGASPVYLGNGDGTFTAAPALDGVQARAVVLADVNRDGRLDVVLGGDGFAGAHLGNGDGTFGERLDISTSHVSSLLLDDLDGDGTHDLVVLRHNSQETQVWAGQGDGTFLHRSVVDVGLFTGTLGDVDVDGDLDLIVLLPWPLRTGVAMGNGDGTFDAPVPLPGASRRPSAHALGDLDLDGDLDLVEGNNFDHANRVYLNDLRPAPAPRFGGADLTSDGHATSSVALGDLDGDGDLDAIAGNSNQPSRVYLNNGTTDPFDGVGATDLSEDSYATTSVAVGDLDGDGDIDAVVGNSGQRNRVYLNNGTAAPFDGVIGVDLTTDIHSTSSVALGDLDRDGDLDVLVGNWGEVNRVYPNNGTVAPFDGVTGVDVTADAHYTTSVTLGDLDGDGDLDAIAGNIFGHRNRVYLNNGSADPFAGVSGADFTADMARNTTAVALGDLEGDGDLDAIAANSTSYRNRVYLNDGSAVPFDGVAGTDLTPDSHATAALALGDLDRDGDLDALVGNRGEVDRVYLNNGTVAPFDGIVGTDLTADSHPTTSVALGDLDRDGDLDAIAGNSGQPNRVYLNGSSGPSTVTPHRGSVRSVEVDGSSLPITSVTVEPIASVPSRTGVEWFVSNTGGARWLRVTPGVEFTFPTVGSDLRWRVELTSASPTLAPVVDQVTVRYRSAMDGGDAPASYGTLRADEGAFHVLTSDLRLGSGVDADTDGLPSADVLGDDADGIDDEDGVMVTVEPVAGGSGTFEVVASGTGVLDAWVDFDGDGTWADPDERIADGYALTLGSNLLDVDVPAAAVAEVVARFRVSSAGGLAPTGIAMDGEVEDHLITVDLPPVATDDRFDTPHDAPLDIPAAQVLGNDTDPDGDDLSLDAHDASTDQGGTVTRDGDVLTYAPPAGFVGVDRFAYTVGDGRGGTDIGTVTVDVGNGPPTAVADRTSTAGNTPVSIRVATLLANDTDPEADPLQLDAVDAASTHGGTVERVGDSVTYTPADGFRGTDAFTYTVADSYGATDTATVTVEVANLGPVAGDDALTAERNQVLETAVAVLLRNDTDPNGDDLRITVTDAVSAQGGDVDLDGGTVSYTPPHGFVGDDEFTYTLADEVGARTTATVQLRVTDPGAHRLSGLTRIETAVQVSVDGFADGAADAAVLARADDFADALAGAPFAHAANGPMLLTFSDGLAAATAAEIRRVLQGGRTVHVLGGPAAIDDDVVRELRSMGYVVQRHGGGTRYDTAALIADTIDDPAAVYLVRGDEWPDGLAAGPAAARNGAVILLTANDDAHEATSTWLLDNPHVPAWSIGGGAAAAYPAATPLVGETRVQTALLVAQRLLEGSRVIGFARSDEFADALAAGPHLARLGGTLLLTAPDALAPDVADWLDSPDRDVIAAFLYGGVEAIAPPVADAIADLIA